MDEDRIREFLASPGIIVLLEGRGLVFVAHRLAGLAYRGHQAALPGYRGKVAVAGARRFIAWMFKHTRAEAIVGIIPESNKPSLIVAAHAGFKRRGEIPGAFLDGGAAVIMAITRATLSKGPEGGNNA
jgi:hypothetical protein